jgi:hypothetical protein
LDISVKYKVNKDLRKFALCKKNGAIYGPGFKQIPGIN